MGLIPPPAEWSSSSHSTLPVYHGTMVPAKLLDRPQGLWDHGLIIEFGRANELSPRGAAYTSFSALRSFLWAVFSSLLTEIDISQHQGELLMRQWSVNPCNYHGIFLMEFTMPIPPPVGHTHIVLNAEQAGQGDKRTNSKTTAHARLILGKISTHPRSRPRTVRGPDPRTRVTTNTAGLASLDSSWFASSPNVADSNHNITRGGSDQ